MTVIIERPSNDKIVIKAIILFFTVRRVYHLVESMNDTEVWYNPKLRQEVSKEDIYILPDRHLLWGKK